MLGEGAQTDLTEKLVQLPDSPGVYLMRDPAGEIIYVGKASSLKNRVRSYFHAPASQSPKVQVMMRHVADLEYIVTRSEVEALVLECNLIKSYRPRYNINLKDDKSYPYLKLAVNQEFPYMVVTRQRVRDGSRYFGPYTNVGALHDTLRWLRRYFSLRTCRGGVWKEACRSRRPCLDGHIGRCCAPCAGKVSREEYQTLVQELVLFLEGKGEDLVRCLEEKMQQAAERLAFEEAARWRDQLAAVRQVLARQQMATEREGDQDFLGLMMAGNLACVQVFFVRDGRVTGREHFYLEGEGELNPGEALAAFVQQYYSGADYVPGEIVLSQPPAGQEVIQEWLSQRRGKKVCLAVPVRGERKQLLSLVEENARLLLDMKAAGQRRETESLLALQEVLGLPAGADRIECYDISNLQGSNAVGSMVVFLHGRPVKGEYRRFQIKDIKGPDDYASLREILGRRFSRLQAGDAKFAAMPDLILIDGGQGQLSAAVQVMKEMGVGHIPVFGLAKREEEIFAPGMTEPLRLPRDSAALQLLQRVRDEAHRFAVTYHRQLRGRQLGESTLDAVAGIGPRRKAALLQAFGSVARMQEASLEDLAAVAGMNRQTAGRLYAHLHPEEQLAAEGGS